MGRHSLEIHFRKLIEKFHQAIDLAYQEQEVNKHNLTHLKQVRKPVLIIKSLIEKAIINIKPWEAKVRGAHRRLEALERRATRLQNDQTIQESHCKEWTRQRRAQKKKCRENGTTLTAVKAISGELRETTHQTDYQEQHQEAQHKDGIRQKKENAEKKQREAATTFTAIETDSRELLAIIRQVNDLEKQQEAHRKSRTDLSLVGKELEVANLRLQRIFPEKWRLEGSRTAYQILGEELQETLRVLGVQQELFIATQAVRRQRILREEEELFLITLQAPKT